MFPLCPMEWCLWSPFPPWKRPLCKFLDIIKHCICYPCSFSFQLFANFMHWRFMACADMLDELQEHVESIDMANGNVYIVSYVCACMRVTRVRTCTHTRTHTHTSCLWTCSRILFHLYCTGWFVLFQQYDGLYIYPCITSIFTNTMLVDGLC